MILTNKNTVCMDDEISEVLDNYFVNSNESAVNRDDELSKIAMNHMFSNEFNKFKYFIKNNINIINKMNSDGLYLLHLACYAKKYECVLSLLSLKADPNYRDSQNKTASHYAVISGDTSIINMLVLHSANINIQDSDGDTSLHYAVSNNDYEMIKTLIKHNVNPMIENNNNMVAINYTIDKQILKELSIYMAEYIK